MKRFIVIVCTSVLMVMAVFGQVRWSFELQGSIAENVPMPLHISQNGYPDINLNANFISKSLTAPISWDWRFSRWQGNQSWEIEAIHHKIYLVNTTNEVERFNISHGFNIVTINRGFKLQWFFVHSGLGIVLAHAENIVRSLSYDDSQGYFKIGYYEFAGPVLNFSISRPINISKRLFINAEAKSTLAYARVKVVNGHADVYNIAFHLVLGFGGNFILKD